MWNLHGRTCTLLLAVNNFLTAGTILLLLCLLYALYRLWQENKRLRATKKEETADDNRRLLQLQKQYAILLAEKEWLIKEVQHRVKNNLQLVISLLNMQTGYLKDEFALDAFGDIGSRIRAISLIHQRMYQEQNNMTTINMRDYITELIGSLETGPSSAVTAAAAPNTPVDYRLDIAPIQLDVSQSVPVGLILNEAITNAIKHALPARQSPTITISMSMQESGLIRLTVADNGRGLPANFNLEANASMGLQLIKTLSTQLDGDLHLENHNGFTLTLQFIRQKSSIALSDFAPTSRYN